MIFVHRCSAGLQQCLRGAVLLVLTTGLLTGCQTTSAPPKYLTVKYETAVNCARAHVDQRLTPKKETEGEIGTLVRAAIIACEAPMNAYIQAIFQNVMSKRKWTWLGQDSQVAITDEIVLSTSVMLQHEYNEKERKS